MTQRGAAPPSNYRFVIDWLAPIALAGVFVLACLPTLGWLEFWNPEESVNVATAIELHLDGNLKVPTLAGVPRIVKPPLTAWATGLALDHELVKSLAPAAPGAEVTERLYQAVAFSARWPVLVGAGVVLVAVYHLARMLGGTGGSASMAHGPGTEGDASPNADSADLPASATTVGEARMIGFASMMVCGTSFLFLRHAALATTDAMLALWVAVAMTLLTAAVLRGRYWVGFGLGGLALGLGLMSKGHMALLQTVLPLGAYLWWARWNSALTRDSARRWRVPLMVGMILAGVVGLWWYGWVGMTRPGIIDDWVREVTRVGANDLEASPIYRYFISFRFWSPWTAFVLVGIYAAAIRLARRPADGAATQAWMLAFFQFAVPFAVMVLFPEKKDRYLLPLVPPLSIVAAVVAFEVIRAARRGDVAARVVEAIQWALIILLAVSLPLAGLTTVTSSFTTVSGTPWFQRQQAAVLLLAGGLVVGIGLWLRYRRGAGFAIFPAGAAVVLLAHGAYIHGLSRSLDGTNPQKPLAMDIRRESRDPSVYSWHPSGNYSAVFSDGAGLQIYLGRVVRWTPTPGDVAPPASQEQRDMVVFTVRGRQEEPVAPPGPWRQILDYPATKRSNWIVWERQPAVE